MRPEEASQGFAALGSEARLCVVQALVRAGARGLSVGDIQVRTGIAPSTLAHHLRFLAAAGLVVQVRAGRSTLNRADFQQLKALGQFVLEECCIEQSTDTHDTNAKEHANG